MATTSKAASKPKTSAKTTGKSADAKRTELKEKVDAAQQRNEERSLGDYARNAGESATSFVKEHPITTVVGGLALGVLIASIVPGPGRRLRKKATARSAVLAGALADLAVTYGSQVLDSAEKAAGTGTRKLSDLGSAIGDSARSAGRGASTAAESAGDTARDIGRAAVRTLRELRGRTAR
ncbi:MAG: hypothetical protein ACEQR8_11400 [Cypionkella sp.]